MTFKVNDIRRWDSSFHPHHHGDKANKYFVILRKVENVGLDAYVIRYLEECKSHAVSGHSLGFSIEA